MKIHSDRLTRADLQNAATTARNSGKAPGIYVDGITVHGSRSRRTRFNAKLRSSRSNRHPNSGQWGAATWESPAASWDDHGHWIAWLFHLDPDAKIAHYDGSDDFHRQTDSKYELDLADFA